MSSLLPKQAEWSALLSEFYITISHISGKQNKVANCLSCPPVHTKKDVKLATEIAFKVGHTQPSTLHFQATRRQHLKPIFKTEAGGKYMV
jgi:hypothetical protein